MTKVLLKSKDGIESVTKSEAVKKEVNGYWYEQFKRDYPAMIEYIEKRIKVEVRHEFLEEVQKKFCYGLFYGKQSVIFYRCPNTSKDLTSPVKKIKLCPNCKKLKELQP